MDEAVDVILKCIFDSSPDKSTLTNIKVSGNALTRFPPGLNKYFYDIKNIEISYQEKPGIQFISAFDFPRAHLIASLYLKSCHIKQIKPNTLKCKKN